MGVKWDQLEGLPADAGSVGPRTAGWQLRRRAIMTKVSRVEPGGGVEAAVEAEGRSRGLTPVVEDSPEIWVSRGAKVPIDLSKSLGFWEGRAMGTHVVGERRALGLKGKKS